MKKILTLAIGLLAICAYAGKKDQLKNAAHITELTNEYGITPSIYPVSEGIFAVGEGPYFSFYRTTGGVVFNKLKVKPIGRYPSFNNGAVLVRQDDERNKYHYVILYADGTRKDLPESYNSATDFVDGVARMTVFDMKTLKNTKCWINTRGEKVFQNLGNVEIYEVGKLVDNRRPFRSNGDLWGYLDGEGKIVIKPQFINARPFSENHAGVTVKVGEEYKIGFINQDGSFSIQPKFKGYRNWNSKIGDLHCGRIRVMTDDGTSYYDETGNLVFQHNNKGRDFVDGVAWLLDAPEVLKIEIKIVDVFGKLRSSFDTSKGEYDWGNNIYSKCGLTIGQWGRSAYDSAGTFVINDFNSYEKDDPVKNSNDFIGVFSDDGYAHAKMYIEGEYYYGIIGQNGNFTVIFDDKVDLWF